MAWSARWTRRGVVGLLFGALAQRLAPVARAQTAGCEIGFVNGLLTVGGNDCDLFSPPGLGDTQVAAPSHLAGDIVDDTTATDTSSTSDVLTAEERRLRRRDHHQQKKDNNQDHKQDKRNRKENHLDDVRDRKITCEDFADQKEAIEWLAQFPEDADALDPAPSDGIACEHLDVVRCSDFSSKADIQAWLNIYFVGYSPINDPFNLYRGDPEELCPGLDEE